VSGGSLGEGKWVIGLMPYLSWALLRQCQLRWRRGLYAPMPIFDRRVPTLPKANRNAPKFDRWYLSWGVLGEWEVGWG